MIASTLTLIVAVITSTFAFRSDEVLEAVRSLHHDVLSLQWNETVPLDILHGQMAHRKGDFQNDIHLNFVGNPINRALRFNMSFPDNNMFVSAFVIEALLQAELLTPQAAKANDTSIASAMENAIHNRDNYQSPSKPIFGFWPQEPVTDKHGHNGYEQWSINLSTAARDITTFGQLLKSILESIGMGWAYEKYVLPFEEIGWMILRTFNIVSDADDTACMLAMTRYLELSRDTAPKAREAWVSRRFDVDAAYDLFVEYSYCPRNGTHKKDLLDSRSYYWARSFISTLTEPDECVVSTWLENYDEEIPVYKNTTFYPMMPFNMNNIDPTVASNALYGMTTSLLMNNTKWFTRSDGRARKLYVTTAKFLAFALNSQLNQTRPDLEMLYYPPVINLPFFVARPLRLLQSRKGSLPFKEMEEVLGILRSASQAGGLAYIRSTAKTNCGGEGRACWTGFLGQADTDFENHSMPSADDRFYSTAAALNALLDIYTTESDDGKRLRWAADVPADARSLIVQATNWILDHYKLPDTTYFNCFFSGSVKSSHTLPFFFPTNRIINMNNETAYTCDKFQPHGNLQNWMLFGVQGTIPESDYQRLVKEGCAGLPSLVDFTGYNFDDSPWPFWSAPVLSKAWAMLALAKVHAVMQ